MTNLSMNEIMDLARDNNLSELIEKTKDITDLSMYLTSHGETILHLGGRNNNVQMIEYGLSKKCYVNMCDYYGATPLYQAASKDSFDAVKYLVSKNADPRLKSAFSGLNSYDTAKDKKVKEFLLDYLTSFEKILSHPYSNFAYRVAYESRYSLFSLLHPRKGWYNGSINKLIQKLYDDKKITDAFEFCKAADKKYEMYLLDDKKYIDFSKCDTCLICDEKSSKMTPCDICNKAYICEKCRGDKNEYTQYKLTIHTNNCNQGLFGKVKNNDTNKEVQDVKDVKDNKNITPEKMTYILFHYPEYDFAMIPEQKFDIKNTDNNTNLWLDNIFSHLDDMCLFEINHLPFYLLIGTNQCICVTQKLLETQEDIKNVASVPTVLPLPELYQEIIFEYDHEFQTYKMKSSTHEELSEKLRTDMEAVLKKCGEIYVINYVPSP